MNALILMGIKHTHLLGIFLELTYFISYFCFCLSRSLDDVKSMDFLNGFVQRTDRWLWYFFNVFVVLLRGIMEGWRKE